MFDGILATRSQIQKIYKGNISLWKVLLLRNLKYNQSQLFILFLILQNFVVLFLLHHNRYHIIITIIIIDIHQLDLIFIILQCRLLSCPISSLCKNTFILSIFYTLPLYVTFQFPFYRDISSWPQCMHAIVYCILYISSCASSFTLLFNSLLFFYFPTFSLVLQYNFKTYSPYLCFGQNWCPSSELYSSQKYY